MLARSDLVSKLIEAHYADDSVGFSKAVTELIREEEKKRNYTVAQSYREALRARGRSDTSAPQLATTGLAPSAEARLEMLTVSYNNPDLSSVVLADNTLNEVAEIANEWKCKSRLTAHGLEPRSKVLFYGPPGCGKTATARAIAGELGLPFALVRFDSLISSFLGQTGLNIKRIFDYARDNPCLMLIDELDAIGKARNDARELGELKRVVITLLQNIDALGAESLLVAATNHEDLLDDALWRRFDVVCRIGLPARQERSYIIQNKSYKFTSAVLPEYDILAELTDGYSGSDLVQVVETAWRRCVLTDSTGLFGQALIESAARHGASHSLLTPEIATRWAGVLRGFNPRKYSFATLEDMFGIPHSTLHNRLSRGKA